MTTTTPTPTPLMTVTTPVAARIHELNSMKSSIM
jgi:hypothetical protein